MVLSCLLYLTKEISKRFLGQKTFGTKDFLGQKKISVKNIFGSKNVFGQRIFWVKKIFGQKKFLVKKILSKNNASRVNPRGRMYDPPSTPTQKIVGLKLCWVVVSFVRRGRIQNFRPLGPLFLIEVEFLVVGGVVVNSNNRVKPNFRLSKVVLGFWQFCEVIDGKKNFREKKYLGKNFLGDIIFGP